MSVVIEVSKNVILQRIDREAREAGRAEGQTEERRMAMRQVLTTRFQGLPQWAESRLAGADAAQLSEWFARAIAANSLTDAIGASRTNRDPGPASAWPGIP